MKEGSILNFVLAMLFSAAMLIWVNIELNSQIAKARTHAHFTEAVQTARSSIVIPAYQTQPLSSQGIPTTDSNPSNTGEWIALFSKKSTRAPGGGPAYIVNISGNQTTGAIGVNATNYGSEVHISRPSFEGLKSRKAIVTATDLVYDPII